MRKRILSFLMSFIMVISLFSTSGVVFAKEKDKGIEKTYLVGFKTSNGKEKYVKQKKVEKELKKGKSAKIKLTDNEYKTLKKDKNVAYIEEDFFVEMAGVYVEGNEDVEISELDSLQIVPYGIEKIGADYTHSQSMLGDDVKVAVFDTGISQHEDLTIIDGISFVESENHYNDLNGHGTHVAGIISAKDNNIGILGVAPNVKLYAVKVLDSSGIGNYSNIIEGIYWAIDNDIDIINMSLGGTEYSQALEEAIQLAVDADILIVAAAGNRGPSNDTITYPAKYTKVIAVGAIDENYKLASFTSRGAELDVVAPGVNILSLYKNNDYSYMSGTSMSAPYVTAAIAVLKGTNENITNNALVNLLYDNATYLGNPENYGAGVLNIAKSAGIIDGPVEEVIVDEIESEEISQDIEFNIKDFDVKLNNYKNKIEKYIEILYTDGKVDISKELTELYEDLLQKDYELHILPKEINVAPKEDSSVSVYDNKVNQYFCDKYEEFIELERRYVETIEKYSQHIKIREHFSAESVDLSESYEFADPVESVELEETVKSPQIGLKSNGGRLDETNRDLVAEQQYEEMQSANMIAQAEPSITIDSTTSTSVTFTVTFPTSGQWGNVMALDDHNVAQPYLYDNITPKNGYYMTNGTYTYSGLTPGGFYYLHMMWSTDGEYYGYENAYYKGFHLPYSDEENLVRTDGTYVYVNMESSDKSLATTSNFTTWLNRLDQSYLALQDLTGNTPYDGNKIGINSERDLNEDWIDGANYWRATYAWSGNPVTFYQPFLRSTMRRLSGGDWSNIAIHELSHDFDKNTWEFDAEVLADFKTYYVVETLGAKVYPVDAEKYYTGSAFANYFKNDHHLDSYSNNFSYGYYTSKGLVWLLINIKNTIGWDPFIETFHYLNELPETNRSDIDTFNLFMTKLKEYSDYDVLSKLTSNDKAVIGDAFNGTVQYLQPVTATNIYLDTPIDINSGNSKVYKFTPNSTGTYIIETSNYAGTGDDFDTVLELYSDSSLIENITINDDGGEGLFSRIEANLTSGTTYYIKVRGYSSNETLYTRIIVTGSVPEITINSPKDVDLSAGEYIVYAFTPSITAEYNIYTGPYGGTGSSNDTYLELYSDSTLTTRIASNDDVDGGRFSRITRELTEDVTYYIKLRHYSSSNAVHARLTVEKNIPFIDVSEYVDIEVSAGEFAVYKFLASETGTYIFETTNYGGGSTTSDTYLELYSDASLTNRIAYNDDGGEGTFSKITYSMDEDELVFIKFRGYSNRAASARLTVVLEETLPDNEGTLDWPTYSTEITLRFGSIDNNYTHSHTGVDIQGRVGEDVLSAANGKVSYIGENEYYGNVVYVNSLYNGENIQIRYSHLQTGSIDVNVGDIVNKGDKIASIGATGMVSICNLDKDGILEIEMLVSTNGSVCGTNGSNTTKVNPMTYFEPIITNGLYMTQPYNVSINTDEINTADIYDINYVSNLGLSAGEGYLRKIVEECIREKLNETSFVDVSDYLIYDSSTNTATVELNNKTKIFSTSQENVSLINDRFVVNYNEFINYFYRTDSIIPNSEAAVMIADGDENRSEYVQVIINGKYKDGTGGLSLAWNNATANSTYTVEQIRTQVATTANELREFDKKEAEFNKTYLINAPEAAMNNGHNAVILSKSDGSSLLFSFYPSPEAGWTSVVISDGTVHFDVLTSDETSGMLDGNLYPVVGIYKHWGDWKGYMLMEEKPYSNNLPIDIDNEEGEAIAKSGAGFFSAPGKYMLSAHQCADVALDILSANGDGVAVTRFGVGIPNTNFSEMENLYED